MFKVPVVSVDKHSVMNQTEKRLSFSSPLPHERPNGWSGMKTQLSATQAELRELKENVSERFTLLEKIIEELIEVINKQDNIIYSLKQENEVLHNMKMSVSKASTHNRDNETNNNLKFHASVSIYKSHGLNNADLSQSNTSEQEIVRNFGNFENSELDESKHIESNSTMLELSSKQTILPTMAHPVPESPNIHSYVDIVKTQKTVPTTKEGQDSQHVPSEPLIALKITKQLED
jgi:hypothetical protein